MGLLGQALITLPHNSRLFGASQSPARPALGSRNIDEACRPHFLEQPLHVIMVAAGQDLQEFSHRRGAGFGCLKVFQ